MSQSNDYSHIIFKEGDIASVPKPLLQYLPAKQDNEPDVKYTCNTAKLKNIEEPPHPSDPVIQNIKNHSLRLEKCVPVGSIHASYEVLFQKIQLCGRGYAYFRKSGAGTIRCNVNNCTAKINCSTIFKKKAPPNKMSDLSKYKNPSHIWTSLVYVSSLSSTCNHPCNSLNYNARVQASGVHSKSVKKEILWLLMNQLKVNPTLPAQNIRSLLDSASPYSKVWNHRDIFNVRVKVKKLASEKRELGHSSEEEAFLEQFNNDEYMEFFNSLRAESSH